jgi:hypothetical protein
MKKILFLITLFTTVIVNAQVPQGISYQAIALNSSGNPVVSSNVGLKLSVLDNAATGTVLYSETHLKTTNPQGLFNLVIGQGTVPYALAADSLITSPGEGITLVSPNGTPYQLTVSDSGELSLPTTNNPSASSPNNFYMYGTFNTFSPTTALLMANFNGGGGLDRYGYRYLTAGTELKFLASNNVSSPIYGVDLSNNLQVNGASFLVDTNGFYLINLNNFNNPVYPLNDFNLSVNSLAPQLVNSLTGNITNSTYSVATNKFTFNFSISANTTNRYEFIYSDPRGSTHGDNLADGSIESNGLSIPISNTTGTPRNYRVELTINFNGSATYTVTQL